MTTIVELNQFVLLWEKIQSIQLSNEADSIIWNIIADGQYSAASAYGIQFMGRIERPELAKAWKIHADKN
jgi:PIN domain nuclease of toxin-antitoxin system